jgi:hypothetical protein
VQDDVVGVRESGVSERRLTRLTRADNTPLLKCQPNVLSADSRVLIDEAKAHILEVLSSGYKLTLSELCDMLEPRLGGCCEEAVRELAEKDLVEVRTVGDEVWVWLKD